MDSHRSQWGDPDVSHTVAASGWTTRQPQVLVRSLSVADPERREGTTGGREPYFRR
jgi:hypothetical protein